ncbi:hypothetical protein GCM10007898_12580 [Dyella flagellata]|uniref:Uncharacterized protein n=1 Tax=Dyella flagellata TaxID=1867833 RepID=A0ABQ5X934_9GAMM|nr:hypothetical protein GCM10007898_12580 [Dyella flagellata]
MNTHFHQIPIRAMMTRHSLRRPGGGRSDQASDVGEEEQEADVEQQPRAEQQLNQIPIRAMMTRHSLQRSNQIPNRAMMTRHPLQRPGRSGSAQVEKQVGQEAGQEAGEVAQEPGEVAQKEGVSGEEKSKG